MEQGKRLREETDREEFRVCFYFYENSLDNFYFSDLEL